MRPIADATLVSLPGGVRRDDGSCLRAAQLRPLRGEDEEWLWSLESPLPQAVLVTELLARCVERIGSEPADREAIRHLLVGDREFLLLRLHAISFGSRIERVSLCPRAECGAKMHVDFDLASVPVEAQTVLPRHQYQFNPSHAPPRVVHFRLPDGADQEAACEWRGLSRDEMTARLLARCLLELDGKTPVEPADVRSLPAEARAALEQEIERRSPRVDFDLEAACPQCGRTFNIRIDPSSFVLQELLKTRPDFERELHLLAFHYHWSLAEILRLPRMRRRRCVRLLLAQLDYAGNPASIAA